MRNLDSRKNLIDDETVLSLDALLEEGAGSDDRTEEEQFFDWTQEGCPIMEDQSGVSEKDCQTVHLVPSAWFG